jgi:hypothetical protein
MADREALTVYSRYRCRDISYTIGEGASREKDRVDREWAQRIVDAPDAEARAAILAEEHGASELVKTSKRGAAKAAR